MTLSEEITSYGRERGIRAQDVQRWLALGGPDQTAMLRLARGLRLGGNHFNDFLDWCVEISLRDGCSIAAIIDGKELAPTLSDSRMSRNDRLKHAKEALRRLRYPRLTRIEDEVRARLRGLKLDPRIRITVAPGLEGGLKVELQAGSVDALARLARELESLAGDDSAREVFVLMEGKEVASVPA
ncbi:MAG: hypothetical protein OXU42_08590 [Deltaproteobacteria bacterium]|nr:hypothetical protein [Deltaproteobacteria bacterium]